ncbi:MAG TPA: TVP38/TMEM64 family protein [Candidatus Avacidaminococcus intestinavium]|uniref:TVP38/TMEM64 family membrane protein n=1 Tax=Candidatus Avacidaminococcus intestinavium TaxID=2840684 RepID=A0A9D1MQQ0_9FIRM|nr:TVP38/TMEM64 family protein [Candidatus Avacidaminococcus intestinavium]
MQVFISKQLKQNWKKIIGLGTLIIVVVFLYVHTTELRPKSIQDIRTLIEKAGAWGPILYISLYAVRTFLFFPSLLMNLSAGVLFGPYWGVVYLVVGGLANATVCFLATRFLSQGECLLTRWGGQWGTRLDGYLTKEHAFTRILWLRLVPVFPYDPISMIAGGSSMSYAVFAGATIIGMLPGAFAYNFFADTFSTSQGTTLSGIVVLTLAFGLPLFLWYYSSEHKKI